MRRSACRPLVLFFLATLIILAELALYWARWVVVIILLGIGTGVILAPLFQSLHLRLKLPKALSILAFVLIAGGILIAVGFLFADLIGDQLMVLQQRLPIWSRALQERIEAWQHQYPGTEGLLSGLDLGSTLSGVGSRVLLGLKVGASTVAGAVFAAVIAIYTAVAPDYYVSRVTGALPPGSRAGASSLLEALARELRRWFRSQLITIVTVGVLVSVGLKLVGLDSWLLFGILSGLLDFVPYVGAIVPAAGATLVALATRPESAVWVIVLFVVVHQLENNLLVPLVMKARMSFPPVLLLIVMLFMGSAFGVVGVLLSPGLFAVLRTLYLRLYLPWIESADPPRDPTSPPHHEGQNLNPANDSRSHG